MKPVLFLFFCCFALYTAAQTSYTPEDEVIFARYLKAMETAKELPVNQLIAETAKFFTGTPYVAATLEKEPEQLIINLREFDCFTLTENCVALALTVKEKHPSFASFCKLLQKIRYRKGEIKDYTSRLHYTTDWINENEKQGRLKNITQDAGGVPLSLQLFFMSANPDKYKQLKNAPELVSYMHEKEQEINKRAHFYIPKEQINTLSGKIQDGDMVCFTTSIKGLDVTHVGFAYWQNNQLTFIHASATAGKVIINPVSLYNYCKAIKSNTGLLLVRIS